MQDKSETSAMLKGPIEMEQFDSSNLVSGLYDFGTLDLYIRFHGEPDRIYLYRFVPDNEWEGLTSASSHGSYHYHNIRMAYPYEELSKTDWPAQGRSVTEKRFLEA